MGTIGLAAGTVATTRAARPGNGGNRAGLRGRVRLADGEPADRDQIAVVGREFGFEYAQTNRGGVFTADVTEPQRLSLGYHQTVPEPVGSRDRSVTARRTSTS